MKLSRHIDEGWVDRCRAELAQERHDAYSDAPHVSSACDTEKHSAHWARTMYLSQCGQLSGSSGRSVGCGMSGNPWLRHSPQHYNTHS